nr:hypothetical protein [Abalone asfa-like virus]
MLSVYSTYVIVYWLVINLKNNITPRIDRDFIVLDFKNEFPPIYHVTQNRKLYILIETIDQFYGEEFKIYIKKSLEDGILANNKTQMTKLEDVNQDVFNAHLWINHKSKSTTKNIIDVINDIPKNYSVPDSVTNVFLTKYPKFSLELYPYLTNG